MLFYLAMKMTFSPTFSTTYIKNEIKSRIGIDFSVRRIKRVNCFRDLENNKMCCLTVDHPLQDGETSYFLKDQNDINKCIDLAKQNGLEIQYT